MNELINEFKKINEVKQELNKKLDTVLQPLVSERNKLEEKIKEKALELKPLQDQLAHIDSEIEYNLKGCDVDEYICEGKKFLLNIELAPKVTDYKKLFEWIYSNSDSLEIKNKKGGVEQFLKEDILLANIVSKRKITDLVDSGIVPEGIEINTFKKFKTMRG